MLFLWLDPLKFIAAFLHPLIPLTIYLWWTSLCYFDSVLDTGAFTFPVKGNQRQSCCGREIRWDWKIYARCFFKNHRMSKLHKSLYSSFVRSLKSVPSCVNIQQRISYLFYLFILFTTGSYRYLAQQVPLVRQNAIVIIVFFFVFFFFFKSHF